MPEDKNAALIIFMIDAKIYEKYDLKTEQTMRNIINDFEVYFTERVNKSKDPIKLHLLLYSDIFVSDLSEYELNQSKELLKELPLKISECTDQKDVSKGGEILAVNKLSSLDSNSLEKEKAIFLFHFCNSPYDSINNENVDINEEIRSLDLKYEIIYFNARNEPYENKLSDLISFNIAEVEVK